MDGQLYIRVRGRVLGPYERDKLRDQVRRGQLSRMHEVSEDGVNWTRASSHADLFQPVEQPAQTPAAPASGNRLLSPPGSPGPSGGAVVHAAVGSPQGAVVAPGHVAQGYPVVHAQQPIPLGQPLGVQPLAYPGVPGAAPAAGPAWYYTQGDQEFGPVDFAQLQQAVSQGLVTADDQVWTDGMADWASPTTVRGLSVRKAAPAKSPEIEVKPDGDIPSGALRMLAGSRGWVLFLSICMFLIAAPTGFWGMFVLFSAVGKAGAEPVLFSGLVVLVEAAVFATAGFLFARIYSRTGEAMLSRKAIHLERTLGAINSLWIFYSSLLIVSFCAMLLMLVLVLAGLTAVGAALHRGFESSQFERTTP